MFYLKRDRNARACVCVLFSPPNSCFSHPAPREARCFTSVMSFTFRHVAGLWCDFFVWRRFVSCFFFYFKDCWGHHSMRLDAPWLAGTVALAGPHSAWWWLPWWSILGVFRIWLIPHMTIYGVCRHEQHQAPLGGGNLVVTVLFLQSPPCHQEHLPGNPDTMLPKPLEMLLSFSQLLRRSSS